MKKRILLLSLIFCAFMFAFTFTACNPSENKPEDPEKTVEFYGDFVLERFSEGSLSAVLEGEDGITLASKDESMLIISPDGKMVAQNKVGKVAVGAYSNGKELAETQVEIVNTLGVEPIFKSSVADQNGVLSLVENSSSYLGLEFSYNGKIIEDAVISFTADTDRYVDIDNKTGVIVSKDIGTTIVTANVAWRGFTDTIVLTIDVFEDISIEIVNDNIFVDVDGSKVLNLSTYNGVLNGKTYSSTDVLSFEQNGAEGSLEEWISSDPSIVSVDEDGVLTAYKEGVAEVYFSFRTSRMSSYSAPVKVKVSMPVLDKTEKAVIVDANDDELSSIEFSLDEIIGNGQKAVKLIVEGREIVSVDGKYDISDFEEVGSFNARFYLDAKYAVDTRLVIASKIIRTVEELKQLYTYTEYTETVAPGEGNEGGGTYYNYGGYFVLGNDIDCEGEIFSAACGAVIQGSLDITYQVYGGGFYGVFDGAGYSIKNAKFYAGGLFGELGKATIKNVRFNNAKVLYAWGVRNGILANNLAGTKIENCYFEVAAENFPDSNNWTCGSSILGAWTYYGATITDCIFVMQENSQSLPMIMFEGGSWNGIQGPYLTERVVVFYNTDEGNIITRESGLTSVRLNEERFITSDKVVVDYTEGESATLGVISTLGEPEYVCEDGNVKINGNKITSETSGKVTVYAKWTIVSGSHTFEYRTKNEITINFCKVTDKTDFVKGYDIYELTENGTQNEYIITLGAEDKAELEIASDEEFRDLILTNDEGISYLLSYNNGYTVSTDKSASNYVPAGEYVVTMELEDRLISFKAQLISKIIRTVEELKQLYTYVDYTETVAPGEGNEGGGTYYNYGGYFVLGNDIDCEGEIFSAAHGADIQGSLDITYQVYGGGFYGVFDGAGYSIKNAKFYAGGLFGELGSATIKNVRFNNAKVLYAWGVRNGILANNLAGTKIENCYFEVAAENFPDSNNWTCGSSILGAWTYYGATITDCEFVLDYSELPLDYSGLPLIMFEGTSWAGIQGPYILTNVIINGVLQEDTVPDYLQ